MDPMTTPATTVGHRLRAERTARGMSQRDAVRQGATRRDPAGRERSGVRWYQILRGIDDPNFVMIDLELDTREEAEALLIAMRRIWSRVEGQVMWDPRAHIVEVVEKREYPR